MHDRVVVELALVADGREEEALEERGPVEGHEGLVGVAGEDHLRRFLGRSPARRFVFDDNAVLAAMHLPHGPLKVDLVLEPGGQVLVDARVPWSQVCMGVAVSISKNSR